MSSFFFFNDTATTEIYTLSLHDALPILSLFVDGKKVGEGKVGATAAMIFSADDGCDVGVDTGSPVSPDYVARSEEHTSELQSLRHLVCRLLLEKKKTSGTRRSRRRR